MIDNPQPRILEILEGELEFGVNDVALAGFNYRLLDIIGGQHFAPMGYTMLTGVALRLGKRDPAEFMLSLGEAWKNRASCFLKFNRYRTNLNNPGLEQLGMDLPDVICAKIVAARSVFVDFSDAGEQAIIWLLLDLGAARVAPMEYERI